MKGIIISTILSSESKKIKDLFFLVKMLDYERLNGLAYIELFFTSDKQPAPGTSGRGLFGYLPYYLETAARARSAAM